MDAHGVSTFVPRWFPQVNRVAAGDARWPAIRACNREPVPLPSTIQKNLSVHQVDHARSKRLFAFNDGTSPGMPRISFNTLQLSEEEYHGLHKRSFGQYIAREAVLNEEYWMAAFFKAQAYWDAHPGLRENTTHKVKFTEQEFLAKKRRCSGQEGNSLKCFCFVAVKRVAKNRRIKVMKSIAGTLELSIRQYFIGETYPGEMRSSTGLLAAPAPLDANKYAYISNVIVAKYARRRGIATNMIYLAADVAGFTGMNKLFVHVNADNTPALELYRKCGFKFFDTASPQPFEDNTLLMCMELPA